MTEELFGPELAELAEPEGLDEYVVDEMARLLHLDSHISKLLQLLRVPEAKAELIVERLKDCLSDAAPAVYQAAIATVLEAAGVEA